MNSSRHKLQERQPECENCQESENFPHFESNGDTEWKMGEELCRGLYGLYTSAFSANSCVNFCWGHRIHTGVRGERGGKNRPFRQKKTRPCGLVCSRNSNRIYCIPPLSLFQVYVTPEPALALAVPVKEVVEPVIANDTVDDVEVKPGRAPTQAAALAQVT